MRSLLVLIDGLGDDPIDAWGGRTPYEQAAHPVMDAIAAAGGLGHCSICEQDIVPESCSCILRLLGSMIDLFGVTHLVNTGVAGSLAEELGIGDLLVSHDVAARSATVTSART